MPFPYSLPPSNTVVPLDYLAPKGEESMAAVPEWAHLLHDFALPSWALFRCWKLNPNRNTSAPHQSSDPQSDGSDLFKPLHQRLPSPLSPSTLSPPCKLQNQPFVYRKEGDLKFRIYYHNLRPEREGKSKRLTIVDQLVKCQNLLEAKAELLKKKKPRNLKEANTVSDAPIRAGNSSEEAAAAALPLLQEENQRNSKRNQRKSKRLKALVEAACSREKDSVVKPKKLSLQLSKEEIAADFLAITCSTLSRRPGNKRPLKIQKELDKIFPNLDWTPDTYKIHDLVASGKR